VKRQEAPGRLELVRDFVNSLDVETDVEAFVTDEGLSDWFAARNLIAPTDSVALDERERAITLREALRSLAAGDGYGAGDVLDAVARAANVSLGFTSDGTPTLAGTAPGITGALGELLVVVAKATQDGRWRRMKICPAEDCRWMFYDNSKNHSGTWCQMAECGNRAKVRAYRARKPADSEESP